MSKHWVTQQTEDRKWDLDGVTLLKAKQKIEEWIAEFGPAATLDIGQEAAMYEDKEYAFVRVAWRREETDEEYTKRTAKEEAQKRQQEERERAEFERLQAKFGEKK